MERTMDIEIISMGRPEYPPILQEIKNPPKHLYCRGDISILKSRCVAVVGSRTTNTYGRTVAEAIAGRLAQRDITVVSGMAMGIDSCAHRGALKNQGKTIAVLGCGLNICYPPENIKMKGEIEANGLVLSEYNPDEKAARYNFPERNRIISGLSEMTVVVQARNRSGALITAELAAEQGREVMAVPGNIDSQYNLGNNKLIREGALPLITPDDVLEPLGLKKVSAAEARKKLSNTEFEIFKLLSDMGEMSIDEICCNIGKSPAYVNPILAVMEMKGFTFSDYGKIFLANV